MSPSFLKFTMLEQDKKDIIVSRVQDILNERFDSSEKRFMKVRYNRLQFACPYCGDSHGDKHKKRGNIYFKNLTFNCYNAGCNKHTNVLGLFKDFGKSLNNLDILTHFLDYINDNKVTRLSNVNETNSFSLFKEWSIELEDIKKKLSLFELAASPKTTSYIKSRLLTFKSDHFLINKTEDKLFIFNFLPSTTKVIGFQIRNFKGSKKYESFNIEKINEIILGRKIDVDEEDLAELNTYSLYFNVLISDFSKTLTILEGPLDSFFIPNSIALTGLNKSIELLDEIESVRYLFDNDADGIKKMEELLKKRKHVFLWKKLIRDFKIDSPIKDVNDLVLWSHSNRSDAFFKLNNYFTNNPLDIRDV